MAKQFILLSTLLVAFFLAGCVQRRLTVVTEPEGAIVWLNDEEIGAAPVTVNFNWYGDYRVRIEKPGYETLRSNRLLERPLHDWPGIDFVAQVLWPGHIVDEYMWEFELQPYQPTEAGELLEQAEAMRRRVENQEAPIVVEDLHEHE